MRDSPGSVTRLLRAWHQGDRRSLSTLIEQVYGDLLRIARHRLRGERPGHSISPSVLVHELYIRLSDDPKIDWANRTHFFAVSGMVMRRVLVEHARARRRKKRRGIVVPLQEGSATVPALSVDIIDLHDAIEKMRSEGFEREAKVVDLRYFGGLSIDETAAYLEISSATVRRAWTLAKSWLYKTLDTPRDPHRGSETA